MLDITYRKSHDWYFLSTVFKGYFVHRAYLYHTKKEATKKFKEALKEI
jgi:hypothetical protein